MTSPSWPVSVSEPAPAIVNNLTALQANFDISGNQGIPQALNNLLQSFSAWGATPNNAAARQTVIQRATELASAFQQTSHSVASRARDTELQIGQTVDQVNQLVGADSELQPHRDAGEQVRMAA